MPITVSANQMIQRALVDLRVLGVGHNGRKSLLRRSRSGPDWFDDVHRTGTRNFANGARAVSQKPLMTGLAWIETK